MLLQALTKELERVRAEADMVYRFCHDGKIQAINSKIDINRLMKEENKSKQKSQKWKPSYPFLKSTAFQANTWDMEEVNRTNNVRV